MDYKEFLMKKIVFLLGKSPHADFFTKLFFIWKPEDPVKSDNNCLPTPDKSDSDEEEKKDEEKSVHEEEEEDPDVVRERENAAKYIVETYDPIIVTVHQDSYIRFWNTEVCTCVDL